MSATREVLQQPRKKREALAEHIEDLMDAPLGLLGVVFVLLLVTENFSEPTGGVKTVFEIATYILAAVFVAEFVLRMTISPLNPWPFLRRNWWQVPLLVLPFFRFARVLSRLRIAHASGMASSATRLSRSASGVFTQRAAWLAGITLVVILIASELVFSYARGRDGYDAVLHDVALTTITGEPLHNRATVAQVLEIVLGIYQVAVFASLAGIFGAFFLGDRPTASGPRRTPARPARKAAGRR